jgi:predicted nucleic acid-binding protein
MRLVIDTNIVISSLLAPGGLTRCLLFDTRLRLHSPPFLLQELEAHASEISSRSGLSELEWRIALAQTTSRIRLDDLSRFKSLVCYAASFSPDPADAEFLALGLKLGCPLWSNDKKLKEQMRVRVLSTHELAKLLERRQP